MFHPRISWPIVSAYRDHYVFQDPLWLLFGLRSDKWKWMSGGKLQKPTSKQYGTGSRHISGHPWQGEILHHDFLGHLRSMSHLHQKVAFHAKAMLLVACPLIDYVDPDYTSPEAIAAHYVGYWMCSDCAHQFVSLMAVARDGQPSCPFLDRLFSIIIFTSYF